jgi:hypothetical protein
MHPAVRGRTGSLLLLALALSSTDSAGAPRPHGLLGLEAAYDAAQRDSRFDSWAEKLTPVEVEGVGSRERKRLRLYASNGEIDPTARAEFERLAAGASEDEPHALAERLLMLVFKAAYHFAGAPITIVSGWRDRAGRHTAGDALDFRLLGVQSPRLAAYLRGLARVGVGIYTHPRTQFVHLDVRDQSYHWLDASPPGRKWREMQLRDARAAKRDAAWTPESDLPL